MKAAGSSGIWKRESGGDEERGWGKQFYGGGEQYFQEGSTKEQMEAVPRSGFWILISVNWMIL